jgi:hypothetical protein
MQLERQFELHTADRPLSGRADVILDNEGKKSRGWRSLTTRFQKERSVKIGTNCSFESTATRAGRRDSTCAGLTSIAPLMHDIGLSCNNRGS